MSMDTITGFLIGASVATLLQWITRRVVGETVTPRFPLTTPTDAVVLAEAKYPDGMSLTETARLSILHGGPNKIQDIKAIRAAFKVGLRDTKDIVDNLPQTFNAFMPKARAQTLARHLESTGMKVLIT